MTHYARCVLTWYTALLVRRRRWILAAAGTAACLVMAVTALTEATPGLGLALVVAALALILLDVGGRRPRTDEFDVRGGGFATPGSSTLTTVGLANLCLITACFVAGVHDAAGQRAPWGALLAAYVAPLLGYGYGLWHGVGVTFTPAGLHAGRLTGAVRVPWEALATVQYQPDPDDTDGGRVIVRYACPSLVVTAGRPIDTDALVFAGTRRDTVAAAIRHYLARPQERSAIGTAEGYERLRAAVATAAEAAEPRPPIPAPTARRRARNALAGAALLVIAGPLWVWISEALPGHPVGDLAEFFIFAPFAGVALLFGAAAGLRMGGVRRPATAVAAGCAASTTVGPRRDRRVNHPAVGRTGAQRPHGSPAVCAGKRLSCQVGPCEVIDTGAPSSPPIAAGQSPGSCRVDGAALVSIAVRVAWWVRSPRGPARSGRGCRRRPRTRCRSAGPGRGPGVEVGDGERVDPAGHLDGVPVGGGVEVADPERALPLAGAVVRLRQRRAPGPR